MMLAPGFRRWKVALPPGGERAYDEAEWHDALVYVESGEIELEAVPGERGRFGPGAVLCLTGLELRLIRNTAREPAVLVAFSRAEQKTVESPAWRSSTY
jgi:CRP-like cAMP-binding protein